MMRLDGKLIDTPDSDRAIVSAVRDRAYRLWAVAVDHYPEIANFVYQGIEKAPPAVKFYSKGHSAGTACVKTNDVCFSLPLARDNLSHYLADTIPHEIAHIVAGRLAIIHGLRYSAHGALWKTVCVKLVGRVLDRAHTLDLSKVAKVRRSRCTLYVDPVTHNEHWISTRRIKPGRKFRSNSTGNTLRPTDKTELR